LNEFNAQDLSNTVWAFATAKIQAPQLFEAVAAESRRKLTTFSVPALRNICWAFSEQGIDFKILVEGILRVTKKHNNLLKKYDE
jgi:hypothetical protein